MNPVLTIARKELLDSVRDRRTLLAMVLVPILMIPLMFVGLDAFIKWQEKQTAALDVRVAMNRRPVGLAAALRQDKQVKIVIASDPRRPVKREKADVGLVVPAAFERSLARGAPLAVKIVVDEANPQSMGAQGRVAAIIETLNQEIVARRLAARGVDARILKPIEIKTLNVATEEEMGGLMLSYLLPMILALWSIMGGMYAAIDLSAGEKERSTLESLLLTPAKRYQIVLGKFLTVSIISITTVVLATTSIFFTIQRFPLTPPDEAGAAAATAQISLSPGVSALILLTAVLVAALASALMLTIGIFAKSFKEGQNYMTPLLLLAVMPIMFISMSPGAKFAQSLFLIPMLNAVLTFRELVMGKIIWSHIALTTTSSAVSAALALVLATNIFSQERVMFRE